MTLNNFFEFLTNQGLFLALLSLLRYLTPVIVIYWLFYVLKNKPWQSHKIQARQIIPKLLYHDVRLFIRTLFLATLIFIGYSYLINNNFTQVQADSNTFTVFGLVLPIFVAWCVLFVILLILQDTYFYWVHRAIHHRKLYKWVHMAHHRSNPTNPFTSFAVSFFEGLAEFGFLPLVALFLPLPISFFWVYSVWYVVFTTYQHLGYEILPKKWVNLPVLKYINTAVHHDLHHSKLKYNFGLYFNIWDRLAKTQIPEYEASYTKVFEPKIVPTALKQ